MYDTEEKKIKEARPEKSCWTWVKQRKRGLIRLTTMKLNQLCAKKSITIRMRRPYHPGWHPLVKVHNNFLNNCFYKSNLLLRYTVNLYSVAENKHSSPISSIISIMAVPGQEQCKFDWLSCWENLIRIPSNRVLSFLSVWCSSLLLVLPF